MKSKIVRDIPAFASGALCPIKSLMLFIIIENTPFCASGNTAESMNININPKLALGSNLNVRAKARKATIPAFLSDILSFISLEFSVCIRLVTDNNTLYYFTMAFTCSSYILLYLPSCVFINDS